MADTNAKYKSDEWYETNPEYLTAIHVANTSVAIKGSAGFLHSITVGNISGPSICVYNAITPTGSPVVTLAPGAPVGTYNFDITMATGITLNTQGAVTPIVQVSYR